MSEQPDSQTLAELHQEIQSDDWDTAVAAAFDLAEIGGPEVLRLLFPLLESPTPRIRNIAAIALREMGDNAALEPLKAVIFDPRFVGTTGTQMYALETLDCSHELRFLFEAAFTDSYEVQHHALTILSNQQFRYTLDDLEWLHLRLAAYTRRTDRPPDTDLMIRDLRSLLDDLEPDDD